MDLSSEELKVISSLLSSTQSISACGIAQLYLASLSPDAAKSSQLGEVYGEVSPETKLVNQFPALANEPNSWVNTKVAGAVLLVVDRELETFLLMIVDLRDYVLRFQFEVYYDMKYESLSPTLYVFELEHCIAGFNFNDEHIAKNFGARVQKYIPHLKGRSWSTESSQSTSSGSGKPHWKRTKDFLFSRWSSGSGERRSRSLTEEKPGVDESAHENVKRKAHMSMSPDGTFDVKHISKEWKLIFRKAGIRKRELMEDPNMSEVIHDVIANTGLITRQRTISRSYSKILRKDDEEDNLDTQGHGHAVMEGLERLELQEKPPPPPPSGTPPPHSKSFTPPRPPPVPASRPYSQHSDASDQAQRVNITSRSYYVGDASESHRERTGTEDSNQSITSGSGSELSVGTDSSRRLSTRSRGRSCSTSSSASSSDCSEFWENETADSESDSRSRGSSILSHTFGRYNRLSTISEVTESGEQSDASSVRTRQMSDASSASASTVYQPQVRSKLQSKATGDCISRPSLDEGQSNVEGDTINLERKLADSSYHREEQEYCFKDDESELSQSSYSSSDSDTDNEVEESTFAFEKQQYEAGLKLALGNEHAQNSSKSESESESESESGSESDRNCDGSSESDSDSNCDSEHQTRLGQEVENKEDFTDADRELQYGPSGGIIEGDRQTTPLRKRKEDAASNISPKAMKKAPSRGASFRTLISSTTLRRVPAEIAEPKMDNKASFLSDIENGVVRLRTVSQVKALPELTNVALSAQQQLLFKLKACVEERRFHIAEQDSEPGSGESSDDWSDSD